MRAVKTVAVFCGSSNRADPKYLEAARATGRFLAGRGIDVVFGGGRVGMMGALADAVLGAGGRVLGVIPKRLVDLELLHNGCTETYVVDGMHPRKKTMAELSDAFIALPGGYGTMDELFEAVTWTQLEFHHKPAGLLNVDGYYDPLIAWVERACEAGFVRPQHRVLIRAADTPEKLLEELENVRLPRLEEWIADP